MEHIKSNALTSIIILFIMGAFLTCVGRSFFCYDSPVYKSSLSKKERLTNSIFGVLFFLFGTGCLLSSFPSCFILVSSIHGRFAYVVFILFMLYMPFVLFPSYGINSFPSNENN